MNRRLCRAIAPGLFAAALYLAAAHAAMVTQGQFAVSDSGAATYGIPIQVPPGTAGLAPQLALNYHSQGGNGLLGMGWSLSGLSRIGRCPRTMAQDGVKGGVNFDGNDRYCLDGQRLIAIQGAYGADQTEYRTEREGFSKIVSYGTAGNGPAWFKVWTKAGQVMEYGRTADSLIEAQGKTSAAAWAVSKVQDAKGNYYTVSYTEDTANGNYYPSRIDYSGNANAGTMPNNSVQFQYESRPDVVPAYQAGSLMKSTVRLASVKTYSGASLVGEYRLTYDNGAGVNRSRLLTVTQCDGAGACLSPIAATYQQGTALGHTVTHTPFSLWWINNGRGQPYTGDWNGDGVTDVMWIDLDSWRSRGYTNLGGFAFSTTENPFEIGSSNDLKGKHHFGDWNGDGITDVMWFDPDHADNQWCINNGVLPLRFTCNPGPVDIARGPLVGANVYFGDWNGDGITDVVWHKPDTGENRWYIGNGALGFTETLNPISSALLSGTTGKLHFGDWNGDGITDMMWSNSYGGGARWFVNNGALGFTEIDNNVPSASSSAPYGKLYFGDWNGDGITDVMWHNPDTGANSWSLNDGALGFIETNNPIPPTTIRGDFPLYFGDWNGDGITDVMWQNPNDGTNLWYVNNGTLGFAAINNPIAKSLLAYRINGTNPQGQLFFGDWNGDGIVDLGWYKPSTDGEPSSGTDTFFTASDMRTSLLTAVTDGLGKTFSITYQPLTNSAVYTKDSGGSYPTVDLRFPMQVVSSVSVSNGIGGTQTTTYKYGGLKADMKGRGLLGFRWVDVAQTDTGLTRHTEYRQDWPYTGAPSLVKKTLAGSGNAGLLNQVVNTYGCTDFTSSSGCTIAAGRRYFPFVAQSVETSWDLNGAALPTMTTATQYDSWNNATQSWSNLGSIYGNPAQVVTSSSDGYSKTTVNTYSNDVANWFIGRLTRATVTSSTP